MKIITENSVLRKPLVHEGYSTNDVEKSSEILKQELQEHGGIGLSANQVGISERICVINVIDEMVLVNPVIVEASRETVAYLEQCLSIPKSMKNPSKTIRHKWVRVKTDNLGIVEFNADNDKWKDSDEFFGDQGLLECVCIQHEIDHLNGILMTHSSRRYSETIVKPRKIGRNEKVMVESPDGKSEFIKYKKALPLLQFGYKIL